MGIYFISLLASVAIFWTFWELTRKQKTTSAYAISDNYTDSETALKQNESLIRGLANNSTFRRAAKKSANKSALILEESGNPERLNPYQFLAQQAIYAITFFLFGGFVGASFAVVLGTESGVAVVVIAIAVAAGGALLGPYYAIQRIKKRSKQVVKGTESYLFELMELIAAFMGDGALPARDAFVRSAPYLTNPHLAEEVDRVVSELGDGTPFTDAMINMRTRIPTTNVISFCNKMIVANLEGTLSAEELVADAKALRADRVTIIKNRAQTAQTISLLVILVGFGVSATVAFFWPVIQQVVTGDGVG